MYLAITWTNDDHQDQLMSILKQYYQINTLRPRQNGRHFADNIFKCIFLNENVQISIKISLNFVPRGQINNIPALVQVMAWRRPGDKPLLEPMMVNLATHIYVTQPQWVNSLCSIYSIRRESDAHFILHYRHQTNKVIHHSISIVLDALGKTTSHQGPLLLKWIHFNPSMDK